MEKNKIKNEQEFKKLGFEKVETSNYLPIENTLKPATYVERCFNNVAFIQVADNWFVPVQVVMCD